MKEIKNNFFIDPITHEPLIFEGGMLKSQSRGYPILLGSIPNFICTETLNKLDYESKSFYEGRANQYDDTLHLTFFTHGLDEIDVRNSFIDNLRIDANHKILEVACGTGRDSSLIANRLSPSGELHLQDISVDMLSKCFEKLKSNKVVASFSLSNASYLPYPNNYFDSVYSFGALGEFADKKKVFSELIRVTKVGGRVVIGDEGVPIWLRNTDFYRILCATNPMFSSLPPLDDLPIEARDSKIEWVINNCFYLISFTVGEGEPKANFDYKIPGLRGGTYRTRFEGQLEGVTKETKTKVYQAAKDSGMSVHDWLETNLRNILK